MVQALAPGQAIISVTGYEKDTFEATVQVVEPGSDLDRGNPGAAHPTGGCL